MLSRRVWKEVLAATSLLAMATTAACTSSTAHDQDDGQRTAAETALSQVKPTGLTKDQLKERVVDLATENTRNTDAASLAWVREQLNPLIADLARIYGQPPVEQELKNGFAGTWQQLWSDDFRPTPPGAPAGDVASIHQVVTDRGYFYNLSNLVVPTPPGAPAVLLTSFLRGKYEADETPPAHVLNIEFTRFGTLNQPLPASEALGQLVDDIESGKVGGAAGPGGPPGRGPVGVKGKIQNLYLDADLRIALGGTAEQSFNKVYVLTRVTADAGSAPAP